MIRKSPRVRSQVLELLRKYAYFTLYYLRTQLGKKRPLLSGVKLSHACNLTCVHCPFWRKSPERLTFAQVTDALRLLHGQGVRIAIIEGGEPFLWRDGERTLNDVVREARRLFFSVGVTTNGTFPIDTEADIVWVSIDGLRTTHDAIRGPTFDKIMANIAASSHPKIYAHITINSRNWAEVPSLVAFLADRVKGITVQFHYPYGEGEQDLSAAPPARRRILDELIELKRDGLPVADSYACLEALKDNDWKCRPWMITSVHPDGRIVHGCYVKERGRIACDRCGFAAHAEISLAYGGVVESVLVGDRIFDASPVFPWKWERAGN